MDAAKIIRKSYKFRIYPSKAQIKTLEMTLDLCRELYNAALQERRDAWKLNKIFVSLYDQQNKLPEIKKIREELNQVYGQVLQSTLKKLDKSFRYFFAGCKKQENRGFPRFKNQTRFNSFCYPQKGFWLKNNKLVLSKIGNLKIKLSRSIQGKIKNCTIKRIADKWFVYFSIETLANPLPKTNKLIGIDVGIESFLTCSDGTKVENYKFFEKSQAKLRIAQRRVNRREKNSKRRKKALLQVQKLNQKILNQRNDFLHKVSTALVKDFDLIAIEKLNILGLSKGILSKQIHDAAWGKFFNMLLYKAESADRKVIKVNPNGTSQECICGEIVKKDLSVRWHKCEKCGYENHRDIVSAKVILQRAFGQSVSTLNSSLDELVELPI